jgi:hypothetical protein
MGASFAVRTWIDNWEKIAKDPDSLLFSLTIENEARYLLQTAKELTQLDRTRFDAYDSSLLNDLSAQMASNSLEATLVRSAKPSSVNRLNHALHSHSNVQNLRMPLAAVCSAFEQKKFLNGLKKTILQSVKDPSNRKEAHVAQQILLRWLFRHYPSEFAKDLPRRIVLRSFFEDIEAKIASSATNNNRLQSSITGIIDKLLQATKANCAALVSPTVLNQYIDWIIHESLPWKNATSNLVKSFNDSLEKHSTIIQTLIQSPNEETPDAILETLRRDGLDTTLEPFFEACLTKIAHHHLLKCLGVYSPQNEISKISEDPYILGFAAVVKRCVYGTSRDDEYTNFLHFTEEGLLLTLAEAVSKALGGQMKLRISKTEISELLRLVAYAIYAEKRERAFSLNLLPNKSFIQVTNLFRFKESISRYLTQLIGQTATDYIDLIKKAKLDISTIDQKKIFIGLHSAKIAKKLTREGSFYIPGYLYKKEAVKAFNTLFKELIKPLTKWRVYFLIGELDCEGRVFQVGKVIFYDARKWDFGESYNFDTFHNPRAALGVDLKTNSISYQTYKNKDRASEAKRNSARAFVDVLANDASIAINSALILVRDSLDTFVFASSPGKSEIGGFRPQLPSYYEAIDLQTSSGLVTMKSVRSSEMLHIDSEYERIVGYYDSLLNSNFRLRNPLVRSLTWFHKGYWEPIYYAKFISYWVALEQLIIAASGRSAKKTTLINLVPKLSGTWRKSSAAWIINQFLQEIITRLKSDSSVSNLLSSTPKLSSWESEPAIIVENIHKIKALCSMIQGDTPAKTSMDNFSNWLTPRMTKAIRKNIATVRKIEKFKMANLNQRRNLLAHEGVTYSLELEIMTLALERQLIEALHAILRFRDKTSMQSIAHQYNRPFQIRKA